MTGYGDIKSVDARQTGPASLSATQYLPIGALLRATVKFRDCVVAGLAH
jgi:hypothetical protein